jgi:predicted transcriptional regulator
MSLSPFANPLSSLPSRAWFVKSDTIMNAWNVARQSGERKATFLAVTADDHINHYNANVETSMSIFCCSNTQRQRGVTRAHQILSQCGRRVQRDRKKQTWRFISPDSA